MASNHHELEHRGQQILVPAFLYASTGLLLAFGIYIVGLFEKIDHLLLSCLLAPVFKNQIPENIPLSLAVLLAVICSYSLAFAVLDTPAIWRRLLLGFTLLVLIVGMVPALAVWQIYFSPFLSLISVFWILFCTMIHVNYHLMPCEISHVGDKAKEVKHG